MNLRQVEAFLLIMELGSATRAAEAMHITQSAASRLVLRLEREVRFPLFVRAGGRLVATEEGKALYNEAARSFIGLKDIRLAADRISQIGTGSLRLCVMPTLQQGLIPALVAQFCRTRPGVSVALDVQSHHEVINAILRQTSELGIATLPVDEAEIQSTPISRGGAVCLVPAGHPLARREHIEPGDLRDVDMISVPRARFSDRLHRLFEQHQVQLRFRIEARTILAAAALVAEGAGVCIADAFSLEATANPRIVMRPLHPQLLIEVGAFFLRRRPLSILAKQFMATLPNIAPTPPAW